MKTILLNRFDGGIAEDVRTTSSNQCELSTNFDIITNTHKLIHHRDQTAETGANVNSMEITDVGMTTIAGTKYMVAFGNDTSSSELPAAYTRTAYDFNGAWTQQAVGVAGYNYIKNTYVQYGGISFILSKSSATTWNLQKYVGAGSLVSVGTFVASNLQECPRPYIHPDDKILYMCVGNTIAKYDIASGSFSSSSTILPTGYVATSIAHFGGFLSVAVVPEIIGESLLIHWGRDIGINTLQGNVNMGGRLLQSIENIEGQLICISRGDNFGSYIDKKIEIRAYYGGDSATLVKVVEIPSSSSSNYNIVKTRKDDKLYFAVGGEAAVYMCTRNKAGQYVVTQDKLFSTGVVSVGVYGLNFVGDVLYVAFLEGTTYKLTATEMEGTVPFINTATYTTTVNPNMPEGDREVDKRITFIQVNFESSYSNGTTTVKYIVDGTEQTVGSRSNTISENLSIKAVAESTGNPFKSGKDIQFKVECGVSNIKSIRYTYETINLS